MPLDDVLDYLKKYPDEWFTSRDITNAVDMSNTSVQRLLRGLLVRKLVLVKLDYDERVIHVYSKPMKFWKVREYGRKES